MEKKNRYLYYSIFYSCLLIAVIGIYAYGWNPPTCDPPGCNLPAPINAGLDPQTKAGSLTIGGNLTTGSFTMAAGAGADKVLTTNASGVATWQTPAPGGDTIPVGVIVMWSGTLATIPSGWHLCDGVAGTPDLRNRFIYGASAGVNPGGTGGSTTHSHTITNREVFLGPMTGNSCTFTDGGENKLRIGLRTGGMSTYNRLQWQDKSTTCPSMGCDYQAEYYVTGTSWSGCVGLQVLNLDNNAVATSVTSLPPYYKLAYIMKL